jgi:hypothetical protein
VLGPGRSSCLFALVASGHLCTLYAVNGSSCIQLLAYTLTFLIMAHNHTATVLSSACHIVLCPVLQRAQDAVQLLSLAVLLSSTFVFNQMGPIDEAALDRLSLVTQITKHVRVRATGPAAGEAHSSMTCTARPGDSSGCDSPSQRVVCYCMGLLACAETATEEAVGCACVSTSSTHQVVITMLLALHGWPLCTCTSLDSAAVNSADCCVLQRTRTSCAPSLPPSCGC